MSIQVDVKVDAKGLACPMPIVRTKKAVDQMESGQVLEIAATDPGSLADIQGWAKSTGNQYLGTHKHDDVMYHYIRKANAEEAKPQSKHPHVVDNQALLEKVAQERITILDVREPAEYAFGHIPGAISIPLGDLESKYTELNQDHEIYIVCRTGSRSDLACQELAKKGYRVVNVVPGMSEWTGPTEQK